MTTIKRRCKKCGHTQTLKNTNKNRRHWACSNCNHRNKLKLSILALIVTLAVVVGPVYADNYTLKIPFDITSVKCNEVTDELIVTCIFQGTEPFKVTIEDKTLTPELIEPETVTDEIVDDPEDKLTNEEKSILRIIDRIETDLIERPDAVPNADKQLLILLKSALDKCEFGIEEGAPIQTYALFGIPQGNLYIDDTDFSKYVTLGRIAKLIQACESWSDYKVKWLGPQYLDIQNATENFVPWTPSAVIPYNVTITDEYMNRAINPHDFIEAEEDAEDFMCSIEGRQRGLCGKGFSGINQGGYVDTTNNPALAKYYQYLDAPEQAIGEPIYDVKTNAKCAVLSAYVKQYELSEESRDIIMREAGCKID